jgi:hypothetical protein
MQAPWVNSTTRSSSVAVVAPTSNARRGIKAARSAAGKKKAKVSRRWAGPPSGVALAVTGLVACGNPPTGIAYVPERPLRGRYRPRLEAFHAKEHHGDDVVFRTRRSPGKVTISTSSSTRCRRPTVV